jgi:hypothetical protein
MICTFVFESRGPNRDLAVSKIQDSLVVESDGTTVFLCHEGLRIAQRGPNMAWVALEPGVVVRDLNYPDQIIVERYDD